jgi:NitT/TauT family transport system substrate-binding protein
MPFKISLPWKISFIAIAWLVFISAAHYQLNFDHGSKKTVYMGYMPVVTNLASPLLDYASEGNKDIRFKALKFSSFSEMAESLRNGKIDVAFIIAPLSIVLKQQGEDIKVVYIGNRNESALVTRKGLKIRSLSDLAGNKIAIPTRFSGHNIALRKQLRKLGLEGQIQIVEMNPPDMASALASGALDAYFVGEPFASRTLKNGDSEKLLYVEEISPNFICNLVIVRADFIKKDPDTVRMLVSGAARSGFWAQRHLDKAAEIAIKYWNAPLPLVNYALNTPKNRILFNLYTPKQTEMQAMADDMLSLGLIKNNNIAGLVDDEFAKAVDFKDITDDVHSIFPKK